MTIRVLLLAVATALTPAQIAGVLDKAERAFHAYVFPAIAVKAAAMLRENADRYETLSNPRDFVNAVNADLLMVTHDKHVHVEYPFDPNEMNDSPTSQAEEHAEELRSNFGFVTVRRLTGNVGYIDFRFFSDDPDVGQTISAAMNFVTNTNALIIDLRHNGGGSPRAAQTLEAYFFRDQQPVTSIMLRDPATGKIEEHQQYTAATVPGPLYLNKRVYLLTSAHTFSCAEQFAYDLHNLHRVTLVGETTGGGANPGEFHDLGEGFGIFMPDGRAYSPVTKTNWEGSGIPPDVAVNADDALTTAYVMALKAIRPTVKKPLVLEGIDEAIKDPAKALAGP